MRWITLNTPHNKYALVQCKTKLYYNHAVDCTSQKMVMIPPQGLSVGFKNKCAFAHPTCIWAVTRENLCLRWFANNKGADQPAHPRNLISSFVIHVLESIISRHAMKENFYFLASLCSWGKCRKPRRQVFSRRGSYYKASHSLNKFGCILVPRDFFLFFTYPSQHFFSHVGMGLNGFNHAVLSSG